MKISPRVTEALLASIDVDEKIINEAALSASALVACGDGTVVDGPENVRPGGKFRIPVLVPEGIPTGDGRTFREEAISLRDLPINLLWQVQTNTGHDGSVVIGRIDSIERLEGDIKGWGNAYGVFDTGPYGREAERLVRDKMIRGVSADLDMFEASVDDAGELATEEDAKSIKNDKITVTQARVMAVTMVPKPAFQECTIELVEDDQDLDIPMEDGVYEEATDDPESLSASLVASAAPVIPPRNWFKQPKLTAPTPITVSEDGQVFGHIAAWNVNHIGLPGQTRPPRSRSNYQYFRTGVLRTDDGDIPVGQLTLSGGHAPLHASASDAVKHYDDTASAIADVTAGEDQFGIWVSGALRPEATPEQVRALRASAPSGDWRPINGRLELVAVCQVNVPGFPVARAMVAGGAITALVAAGARPLAELRESATFALEARLAELEAKEFARDRVAAANRLSSLVSEFDAALIASAAEKIAELEN